MADISNNFRSSMHGFNRDDVIAYIEKSSLEHEKDLRALQDANARMRQQLDECDVDLLKEELANARAALAAAEEKCVSLEAEKAMLEGELAAARQALAEAANAPAPEPIAAPVFEAEEPEPAEASPLNAPIMPVCEPEKAEPAKDYEALELAAYRRAEVAERLARERANTIYDQLGEVFNTASTKLDSNEIDLTQLTQALQLNMAQLQDVLDAIRGSYTDARESFRSFSDRNRERPMD